MLCSAETEQRMPQAKGQVTCSVMGSLDGGKLSSLELGCPAQSHTEHLVLLMTPSPVPDLGVPASLENPPLGAQLGWGAHQPP